VKATPRRPRDRASIYKGLEVLVASVFNVLNPILPSFNRLAARSC
jgi:hypothetical protein